MYFKDSEAVFEIGEKIVDKTGKVCKIVNIEELDYGLGIKTYYVLAPCFTNNSSLRIHTPIDQEGKLRKIMTRKEVENLLKELPSIETIWFPNPKIRKTKFREIYTSGQPLEIFRLIKSFNEKKEEFKKENKALSFSDESFLEEIKTNIYHEIALALNIEFNQVEKFIFEQLN